MSHPAESLADFLKATEATLRAQIAKEATPELTETELRQLRRTLVELFQESMAAGKLALAQAVINNYRADHPWSRA